jgi:hypothetical protein
MPLSLPLSSLVIKHSQDGLCQKPVGLKPELRRLTGTKLMILAQPLVDKTHLKTDLVPLAILDQATEFMLPSRELSRIKCREVFQ